MESICHLTLCAGVDISGQLTRNCEVLGGVGSSIKVFNSLGVVVSKIKPERGIKMLRFSV
jgi:hypothetical protein